MRPSAVAQQVTVNAAGRAVITLQPGSANLVWDVIGYAVALSAGDGELRVYIDSENDSNLIDSTYDASQDQSSITRGELILSAHEKLLFVFTDATEDAIATVRLRYFDGI